MTGAVQNRFCRKKPAYQPESGFVDFLLCNRLQCAGNGKILPTDEILMQSERGSARKEVR